MVAEFAIHPADSVDSVWVKLAHSQEVQGWIREKDMMRAFVPTDSISQAIYLFSETHASYFIVIFALFVAVWLFRAFRQTMTNSQRLIRKTESTNGTLNGESVGLK